MALLFIHILIYKREMNLRITFGVVGNSEALQAQAFWEVFLVNFERFRVFTMKFEHLSVFERFLGEF